MRGKADWIVRGLPTEPAATLGERVRAFPYFVNNLFPAVRAGWIRASGRATVGGFMSAALAGLKANERLAPEAPPAGGAPLAVVVNREGVLLGTIDHWQPERLASEAMNPAPQAIRPDMTLRLAARLLAHSPYLIVSTALGRYLGLFHPPGPKGAPDA